MSAGQWLAVAATLTAALLNASISLYATGPRRRVVIDEIAMRDAVSGTQPDLASKLQESIDWQVRLYVRRRTSAPVWPWLIWVYRAGIVVSVPALVLGLLPPGRLSLVAVGAAGVVLHGAFLAQERADARRRVPSS